MFSDLASCLRANQEGRLADWVHTYLCSEASNPGLAEVLISRVTHFQLEKVPLVSLERIIGPEPSMKYVEKSELFEKRVFELRTALEQGAKFPPLIVTDIWTKNSVSDGGHRLEALRRSGREEYWIVRCC